MLEVTILQLPPIMISFQILGVQSIISYSLSLFFIFQSVFLIIFTWLHFFLVYYMLSIIQNDITILEYCRVEL